MIQVEDCKNQSFRQNEIKEQSSRNDQIDDLSSKKGDTNDEVKSNPKLEMDVL